MKNKTPYKGEENREGYCPVHHIKCGELKDFGISLESVKKNKVPIWIFTIFIALASSIFGYQLFLLREHVKKSNFILTSLHDGVAELSYNQKSIMFELKLPYQELREYEKGFILD